MDNLAYLLVITAGIPAVLLAGWALANAVEVIRCKHTRRTKLRRWQQ